MAQDFKKIHHVFKELVSEKQDKLRLMQKIKMFMKPSDSDMYSRFRRGMRQMEADLFDNTCYNATSNFSISSLSDIINPFEAWFSLDIERKDVDKKLLIDWAKKANLQFLTFVKDSGYYKHLLTDKRHFDLYGFSALTIVPGKRKPVRVFAENPFDLLLYEDYEGVLGFMYVRVYSAFTMYKRFGYVDPDNPKDMAVEYQVLCACVPNDSSFVEGIESNKKYVQLFFIKSKHQKSEGFRSEELNLMDDTLNFQEELSNSREYFNELPSVVVTDSKDNYNPYGEGWGKKILTTAINLNIIRRNMLKGSEMSGNPPFTYPAELNLRFQALKSGQGYPMPYTQQKVEVVPINPNLNEQGAFLGLEQQQVQETIPSFQLPQKKQRQSQEEIQKLLMEVAKNNLSYKMGYLEDGVTMHLQKLFKIAYDAGKIEELPSGLSVDDVKPTLSSILMKDMKKNKALTYTQILSVLSPFISFYPEAFDNFNVDQITRDVIMGLADGSGLEDEGKVTEIRRQRQEIVQRKQQNEQQQVQGVLGKDTARSAKDFASADKLLKEAEQVEEQ